MQSVSDLKQRVQVLKSVIDAERIPVAGHIPMNQSTISTIKKEIESFKKVIENDDIVNQKAFENKHLPCDIKNVMDLYIKRFKKFEKLPTAIDLLALRGQIEESNMVETLKSINKKYEFLPNLRIDNREQFKRQTLKAIKYKYFHPDQQWISKMEFIFPNNQSSTFFEEQGDIYFEFP